MAEPLHDAARAWIADDPDPAGRQELRALLDAGDDAALRSRFAGPLRFGTAGLRGELRAGPNGMNRAVVRRAAAGLARWLGPGRVLVVGHDARHGSAAFARDVAAVAQAAGLDARLLPRALPTPVLAFAVRDERADAGVMVTASHNPPQDNGLKVYLADGAQIVPPADAEIEQAIAAAPAARTIALAEPTALVDDVLERYLQATVALLPGVARAVRLAYTPLHGVGAPVLTEALRRGGFPDAHVEPSQAEPDPDFPTVAFPNPEEDGAMDRVVALGARVGADLVLANDPDADRLAAAVSDRVLTGDELGALLADHVLAHRPGPVATTIVSSGLLDRIAAAHGVPCHRTLTGFKWLMRADPELVYAYEDALGYVVGPRVVRDKDGISAALLLAELAAGLKGRSATLLDRLDELAAEHGLHATRGLAVRVTDLDQIAAMMARLRSAPPTTLAGRPVTRTADLLRDPGDLPASDVVVLEAAGARVVVRPSGTEPKLKAYLEAVVDVAAAGGIEPARAEAQRTLDLLEATVREALGAG